MIDVQKNVILEAGGRVMCIGSYNFEKKISRYKYICVYIYIIYI